LLFFVEQIALNDANLLIFFKAYSNY